MLLIGTCETYATLVEHLCCAQVDNRCDGETRRHLLTDGAVMNLVCKLADEEFVSELRAMFKEVCVSGGAHTGKRGHGF